MGQLATDNLYRACQVLILLVIGLRVYLCICTALALAMLHGVFRIIMEYGVALCIWICIVLCVYWYIYSGVYIYIC